MKRREARWRCPVSAASTPIPTICGILRQISRWDLRAVLTLLFDDSHEELAHSGRETQGKDERRNLFPKVTGGPISSPGLIAVVILLNQAPER
jgi:hypothetical protein